jgi:hypothetical protein
VSALSVLALEEHRIALKGVGGEERRGEGEGCVSAIAAVHGLGQLHAGCHAYGIVMMIPCSAGNGQEGKCRARMYGAVLCGAVLHTQCVPLLSSWPCS